MKDLDTENKRLGEENQQQSNQILQLKERLRTPFNDDEDPALQGPNISNNPKETVSSVVLDSTSNGTAEVAPASKVDEKAEVKVDNHNNNHEDAHPNLGDLNGDDLDKAAANKPADGNDKQGDDEDSNNDNNIGNNDNNNNAAVDDHIRRQL